MPRRRKRIGGGCLVLWRDLKGPGPLAIFLGLMWNEWMTMTDDGVMMNKWCCTGLFLGEISEICWYMCIYIHILLNGLNSGDSSFSWYHDGVVISCWVWLEVQSQSVPFEKDNRQWSTSWSSKMHPKIKRRQLCSTTATTPPVGHGYFLFIFDERLPDLGLL